MIFIDNCREITNEGSYYIVTLPFSEDCPLLKTNFDVDSETIEVEGNQYTVNDCLVSDNGEWINLICDRICTGKEEERKRIGEHLAEVRKELGITQTELAERTGIKQGNIARIEGGKYNSTFDTLTALASAMGKKIDIV